MTSGKDDTDNPFWDFSLRLYGSEGVEAASLDLQDSFGADVNLVLYALYRVAQGAGAWDGAECRAAMAMVAPLNELVIQPLRAVRRDLSRQGDEAALREKVKALELDAERLEQDRLYGSSRGLSGVETVDGTVARRALAVYAAALGVDEEAFNAAAGPILAAFTAACRIL